MRRKYYKCRSSPPKSRPQEKNSLRQEKQREDDMRRAQIEAFLEAIKDICEDVKERVVETYLNVGEPPFSVRVICDLLTTSVVNNKQCAKALLSALQEAEEHTSSVEFEKAFGGRLSTISLDTHIS